MGPRIHEFNKRKGESNIKMIKKIFIGCIISLLFITSVSALSIEKDYQEKYIASDVFSGIVTIAGCVREADLDSDDYSYPKLMLGGKVLTEIGLTTCESLEFSGQSLLKETKKTFLITPSKDITSYSEAYISWGTNDINVIKSFTFTLKQRVDCIKPENCVDIIRGIQLYCIKNEFTQKCKSYENIINGEEIIYSDRTETFTGELEGELEETKNNSWFSSLLIFILILIGIYFIVGGNKNGK